MKVRIAIIVFCFLISTGFLFSQINYSIENISEDLKKNAGSVVRFKQSVFTIKSPSHAQLEVKYAITILHESHKQKAYFKQVYDKFSKINNIEIVLYDKNGKKIKSAKKNDINDISSFSENTLFADIREIVYYPDYFNYPYTIEYSFTQSFKGLLSYPAYYVFDGYDMALQQGVFIVSIPIGSELRYLVQNTDKKPEIYNVKNETHYRWSFKNKKPIKQEDYDLRFGDLVPTVKIAPLNFEMDGYPGNAESWESFGSWIYSLNVGRDELPETTKSEIIELTQNASGNKEKIKLVYEYMQSKTRYVNVMVGIGGWQPFTATEVDETGYGDCKALTNYTFSLLKAVGIESYYVIIKAGSSSTEIKKSLPSNQFNHAILCVPEGNDTIWLECTSQRNPAGYMGTFTEGREALLIKEKDSKLVRTPSLTIDDNLRTRKAKINIDRERNATADIENKYQGLYYDNMRSVYYKEGKRRMDQVRNKIHIKNFSLNDKNYQITEYRVDFPYFIEDYFVSADYFVKRMGDRLLFDINFFNTEIAVPSAINKQESMIYIHRSITRIDSLEFIIPDGYYIKSYPKNDTLVTDYGAFYTHFQLEGNTLFYTRKQLIYKGTFPENQYDDFRSYLKKINLKDNRKVLVLPEEKK
jgi:hypothetical protein